MRFRAVVFVSIAMMLFAACNNSSPESAQQESSDSSEIAETETGVPPLQELFPGFYQYLDSQDSSFSLKGFEGGVVDKKVDSLDLGIDANRIKPYLPYLLFNSDSSMAIDAVTYNYFPINKDGKTVLEGGDPDFAVNLIDFKKKKLTRLLFFGTVGTAMDATWQNDHTAVMVGTNDPIGGDSLLPVVWKYEVPTRSWYVYTYNRMIPGSWSGYQKRTWNERR